MNETAQRRTIVGVAVLLAALAIAAVVAVSITAPTDETTTSTTTLPEAGLSPSTTAVPAAPAPSEPFAGIWPFTSDRQVDVYRADPGTGMFFNAEATTLEFARVYLGMPEPLATTVATGSGGTAEVAVRARGRSPMVTRVQVRRFGGAEGPYAVVGTTTDNIRIDRPTSGELVGSPVPLKGQGRAFEGNIEVEVRQDGQARGSFLGRGIVTGRGDGELGPFNAVLSIKAPTAAAGAVVFLTTSAEDGAVQEATVVRVLFSEAAPTAGRVRFAVFFHRGEQLVRFDREVAPTLAVLRSALQSLLRGPLPADGPDVSSPFSERTADLLAGVALQSDGTAVVDLGAEVPNASTSAASRLLLDELDSTVFQFPTVTRVEYRLRGSCDAFWEWLQLGGCRISERPGR